MLLGIGALALGAGLKKPWLMWLGGAYAAGNLILFLAATSKGGCADCGGKA